MVLSTMQIKPCLSAINAGDIRRFFKPAALCDLKDDPYGAAPRASEPVTGRSRSRSPTSLVDSNQGQAGNEGKHFMCTAMPPA
jgi:hypothetical protein